MEQFAPRAHRGGPRIASLQKHPSIVNPLLANHGKPWDSKVMGTKVSNALANHRCYVSPAAGKILATRSKGRLRKVRKLRRANAMLVRPPDHRIRIFHRKEEIVYEDF